MESASKIYGRRSINIFHSFDFIVWHSTIEIYLYPELPGLDVKLAD